MGKTIGSVILGYLMTVVVFFIVFVLASLLMGADGSFQPGTYDVSSVWIVVRLVAVFFAGILGGMVCLAIARERKPVLVLAVLIIVIELGLWLAIPGDEPGPRTLDAGTFEAMRYAQPPTWLSLLSPFAGAAGVLTGLRLKIRRRRGLE